ncbi:MAG: ribosome maturation factor RimM [Oscillospiraceae bacterium]
MKKQFLECGKIVSTHGIKGEVKINPWCDSPEDLLSLTHIYFDQGGVEKLQVLGVRTHGNMVLMQLLGINTPEDGAALRNKTIYLNRDELELKEGEYFISDLLGLKVLDVDTGEEYGTLSDVSQTGANDVYHITFKDKIERLIPVIPQVVIETAVDEGFIKIRPLKGLFDDED